MSYYPNQGYNNNCQPQYPPAPPYTQQPYPYPPMPQQPPVEYVQTTTTYETFVQPPYQVAPPPFQVAPPPQVTEVVIMEGNHHRHHHHHHGGLGTALAGVAVGMALEEALEF